MIGNSLIHIIVAIDDNGGIGKDGKLLFHNKEDMKQFKEKTMGHVVVMGRKTFDSLPGGPLEGRTNIVLTETDIPGCVCMKNLKDLIEYIKSCGDTNVYIVGGASVYNQFLEYTDIIHLTRFHATKEADTYLHYSKLTKNFDLFYKSGFHKDEEGIKYEFETYINRCSSVRSAVMNLLTKVK
jgi:dihydrofolate reductase